MERQVVIDLFSESISSYAEDYAIVAVDVIRATTTAITCVAAGWRCFTVPSTELALPLAAKLNHPLLVGELGGNMPYGFDVTNSPAKMMLRPDSSRPMILLSSSGTRLIHEASPCDNLYISCLRNSISTARYIASRHNRVAVIGSGTRGEFREEDQMGCSLVAAELLRLGHTAANTQTKELINRWSDGNHENWLHSKSVEYLRDSDQLDDLDFVLSHIEDLNAVFMVKQNEVVLVSEKGGNANITE